MFTLPKLCLNPLNDRASLIAQYLEKEKTSSPEEHLPELDKIIAGFYEQTQPVRPETIMLAMGANRQKIQDHINHPSTVPLSTTELSALGYENFKRLQEISWIRLISICDKYSLANSSRSAETHVLLFKIVEKLALDNSSLLLEFRLYAYLFLRSQEYLVGFSTRFLDLASFLIDSTHSPEILTVVLLDSYFPLQGLRSLSEPQKLFAEESFPKIIEWIKENTTDVTIIETIMKRFAVLDTPSIIRQLIELGLNGTCTIQTLHDALSLITISMINMTEPLFFVLQFNHACCITTSVFAAQVFPITLQALNTVTKNYGPQMTSEIFNIFITPELRTHPKHLLNAGKIILQDAPHLLQDFLTLMSDIDVNANTFNFIMDVINELTEKQKLHPLFSALTTAEDYTGIDITPLINHPQFHIEDYYAAASPAFKNLPAVTIAMQLHCYFNDGTDETLIEMAWVKSKQLRNEWRALSQTELREINSNINCAAFSLIYRIVKNERINNTDSAAHSVGRSIKTAVKRMSIGSSFCGKKAKTPFLRCIVKYLIQPHLAKYKTEHPQSADMSLGARDSFDAYESSNSSANFIQIAYNEAYLSVVTGHALDLQSWLGIILDRTDVPESETLLSLPDILRKTIFEGSRIHPNTLEVRTERRSSNLFSLSFWSAEIPGNPMPNASATSLSNDT